MTTQPLRIVSIGAHPADVSTSAPARWRITLPR